MDIAPTEVYTVIDVVKGVVLALMPLWLTVAAGFVCWKVWKEFRLREFLFKQEYILLEIRLPSEISKSPAAMEILLTSMHQMGGEGSWIDRNIEGSVRPWFSLELVSLEGKIKFFFWIRKGLRKLIESYVYAQYPNVEIHEATDYTSSVQYDPKNNKIWVADLKLDKDDWLPIKTYIDYGLDKDPKEEFKLDPITPLLEMLSQVGKNQQVWIQFLIRAHKKTKIGLFAEEDYWKKSVEKAIKDIMEKATTEDENGRSQTKLSVVQRELIEKLERSLAKYAFDVGGRVVYAAHPDFYDRAIQSGIIGAMKQFGSANLNGFKGTGYSTILGNPWEDFMGIRENHYRKTGLEAYKRRSFFHKPFTGKSFVMNVEALATVYHFPGDVSRAPGIQRVTSKKSGAPSNLPQ